MGLLFVLSVLLLSAELALAQFFPSDPVTNLQAEQNEVESVRVTWNPPSFPPVEYLIRATHLETNTVNSRTRSGSADQVQIQTPQVGAYEILVEARFPLGEEATPPPVTVVVEGLIPPDLSVTPTTPTVTSISISLSQPEFSLPVMEYLVTVARVTEGDVQCSEVEDVRPVISVSELSSAVEVDNLEEFSNYSVEVEARHLAFSLGLASSSASVQFATSSARPMGVPRAVTYSATARDVIVSWNTIRCIERNGEITDYTVVFQEQGGAEIPGEVNVTDRTFTASGLTPHINYTFRVAGVNSAGTGPFIESLILTRQIPGPVSDLQGDPKFTSIVLTWSAPQEPNGVIISYEVAYTDTDGNLVTVNTTDLSTSFTISPLFIGITVTITVSAFTSAGQGETSELEITTLVEPPLLDFSLEPYTDSSVIVSWDRFDIPEITSYTVYYHQIDEDIVVEQSITVISSAEQVVIAGLESEEEYLFEMVATAFIGSLGFVSGQRSEASITSVPVMTTSTPNFVSQDVPVSGSTASNNYKRDLSIAVAVTFVLMVLVTLLVVLLVLCCVCHRSQTQSDVPKPGPDTTTCAVYAEVSADAHLSPHSYNMDVNAAYICHKSAAGQEQDERSTCKQEDEPPTKQAVNEDTDYTVVVADAPAKLKLASKPAPTEDQAEPYYY